MKTKLLIFAAVGLLAAMGVSGQNNTNNGRDGSAVPQITVGKAILVPVQPSPAFGSDQDVPTKDNVIYDDQIIQGSLGVGSDCIDGEVFGYNTVILKENNLRIRFDDTSVSAGFPANDWTLVANDAATGGLNYFAIEDATAAQVPFKLIAGAPENSLFVSSAGFMGLGTGNPQSALHINRNDTPGIMLEQNNSIGYEAQTWEIAGNEVDFFIRDKTHYGNLPFRIQPGTPNNTITLRLSGYVGIGTAGPVCRLDVNGSMRLMPLTVAPSSVYEGLLFMDGNTHMLKYYNGSKWFALSENTDEQDLVAATLTGSLLKIDIENGSSVIVDLHPLIASLEARVAALEAAVGIKENSSGLSVIAQNSPNPFSTQTTIAYNIPAGIQDARLVISNVKGEKIKEIVIDNRGEGSLIIGQNDLASGSYFYTLILDGQSLESKVMIRTE